jgi:hypothetical protein
MASWVWAFILGFLLATYLWHRQVRKLINWLINWINKKSGNHDEDD